MHTYIDTLSFPVYKMGKTDLAVQPVSILVTKQWKVVEKCKKYFLIYEPFNWKCTFLRLQTCFVNFIGGGLNEKDLCI